MELFQGRPGENNGRQDKEIRVYNFLDHLQISYQRVDHAPAMTMEACAQIDQALQATMCKNLLLTNRQNTAFYLLMICADKHFKTSLLSAQIGSSRLSFAEGKYMEEFLDITPGSLSVLGLMNDHKNQVQLLIDRELLAEEYIGCHPCVNTSSLRLKTQDLIGDILPAIGHTPIFVDL